MNRHTRTLLTFVLVMLYVFQPVATAYGDSTVSFSDDPKAIQTASNSVIMLSCYDKDGNLYATGSAFAAFEEGVFVTNCHVIKDEVYSIRAQMETGLEFAISSVVAYDEQKDIAILRTEAKTGLEPLPLGSTAAMERGEKVIAIGSPLGLINTLSIGLYSGTLKDDQVYLQFSAPISHGSSGGALFNNRGEVVGITTASYTEGQNLNLAIPIDAVVELWSGRERGNELTVSAFYDKWDHATAVELSYLLTHLSQYTGQYIRTTGYVYLDDSMPNYFMLVPNVQALQELQGMYDKYQAGLNSTDAIEWAMSYTSGKEKYEEYISNNTLKVLLIDHNAVAGSLITIQATVRENLAGNAKIIN